MQPTVMYASLLTQIVGEPKTWNVVLFSSVCFCHFVTYIVLVFVCVTYSMPLTHMRAYTYRYTHIYINK